MSPLRSLLRLGRLTRRRTAIALLALQAGVAMAPLVERADGPQAVAHADEQGTNHRFAHNDAACAVCAVRTLVADVPVSPFAEFAQHAGSTPLATGAPIVPFRSVVAHHLSRAPPTMI